MKSTVNKFSITDNSRVKFENEEKFEDVVEQLNKDIITSSIQNKIPLKKQGFPAKSKPVSR